MRPADPVSHEAAPAVRAIAEWGWCGTAAGSQGILASTIGHASASECAFALHAGLQDSSPVDGAASWEGLDALRRRLCGDASTDPPLDIQGTEFQRDIWRSCLEIPAGETKSYAWVAANAGYSGKRHSRAAGAALAANTVLVFVPCHRVVGSNGGLRGYVAGPALKQKLIELEQRQLSWRQR